MRAHHRCETQIPFLTFNFLQSLCWEAHQHQKRTWPVGFRVPRVRPAKKANFAANLMDQQGNQNGDFTSLGAPQPAALERCLW